MRKSLVIKMDPNLLLVQLVATSDMSLVIKTLEDMVNWLRLTGLPVQPWRINPGIALKGSG